MHYSFCTFTGEKVLQFSLSNFEWSFKQMRSYAQTQTSCGFGGFHILLHVKLINACFFFFLFFLASNSSVLKIVFSFLLNVCTLTMCNWMWFSITIANTECWLNKKILLLQKRFLVVMHTGVCVAVQPVGK